MAIIIAQLFRHEANAAVTLPFALFLDGQKLDVEVIRAVFAGSKLYTCLWSKAACVVKECHVRTLMVLY